MRRLTAFLVALALVAAPFASTVTAQPVLYGPGGLVNSSGASATVTNSTTATSLYSYTIPAGMLQGNFAPIHVKLNGSLTTNPYSVGTANLGCNFGGSTASLTLLNAVTFDAGLSAEAFSVDLWLSGYTSAQTGGVTTFLTGQAKYQSSTAATVKEYSDTVQGTTSVGSSQAIACTFQWASASATNSLLIYNGKTVAGD